MADDFGEFVKRSEEKHKHVHLPRDPRLRGDDIVKKNEEYIAKHREDAFQRQKADAERRLKDALAAHAQSQHELDETSRLARPSDLIRPGSIEPGLEYQPLSRGRIRVPGRRIHDIRIINRCIVT